MGIETDGRISEINVERAFKRAKYAAVSKFKQAEQKMFMSGSFTISGGIDD